MLTDRPEQHGVERSHKRLQVRRHILSVLLALGLVCGAFPFHPGIPWYAWAGAFVLYVVVADVLLTFSGISGSGAESARRHRSFVLLAVAGVMAILFLVLVWVKQSLM